MTAVIFGVSGNELRHLFRNQRSFWLLLFALLLLHLLAYSTMLLTMKEWKPIIVVLLTPFELALIGCVLTVATRLGLLQRKWNMNEPARGRKGDGSQKRRMVTDGMREQ